MNQYFPSDQCMMFQSHAWVIDPVKVQGRTVVFNFTEYEENPSFGFRLPTATNLKETLLVEY